MCIVDLRQLERAGRRMVRHEAVKGTPTTGTGSGSMHAVVGKTRSRILSPAARRCTRPVRRSWPGA